jgi:hypothetical protein
VVGKRRILWKPTTDSKGNFEEFESFEEKCLKYIKSACNLCSVYCGRVYYMYTEWTKSLCAHSDYSKIIRWTETFDHPVFVCLCVLCIILCHSMIQYSPHFSSYRLGFDPMQVRVKFVLEKSTLGNVFVPVFLFFLDSNIHLSIRDVFSLSSWQRFWKKQRTSRSYI